MVTYFCNVFKRIYGKQRHIIVSHTSFLSVTQEKKNIEKHLSLIHLQYLQSLL